MNFRFLGFSFSSLSGKGVNKKVLKNVLKLESILISISGMIFGVLFGLIFGKMMLIMAYNNKQSDFAIPIEGILITLIVTVILALMSVIIPGRKAANIKIVEALRYE